MKKGPFKMKGYSYPGVSPVKNKDSKKSVDEDSFKPKDVNEYYEKSKEAGEITVDDLLRSIGASPENE